MDSIPAETIASSIPFRFLVGPNQREFSIHSALLTHQSPVLERLVNGSFSEAAEKCVTWKSVDEGTFISFWQHTYTGKYTTDHPIIGLKPESEANREAEKKAVPEVERVAGEVEERAAQESIEAAAIAKEEEELAQLLEREANTFTGLSSRAGWRLKELQANAAGRVAREAEKRAAIAEEEQELAALLDKRHRRGKLVRKDNERIAHLQKKAAARGGETTSKELTKREAQWNVFKHQRDSASFGAFRSTDLFGGGLVRSNRVHEDYTNTLLSHARLYVFAECYGITGLMELSLNELHRSLVTFALYEERVDDIVALVRYCFENMVPDALREITTQYVACKIEKLWPSEEFQALVEAHGELSKSLIGLMLNVM